MKKTHITLDIPMTQQLTNDVITLVYTAKQRTAVTVNAELTLLYWQVGQRIDQTVLEGERADYGQQVIGLLSKALTEQFGKGWSAQQLRHCLKFAQSFSDEAIVSAVRRQLSWTHFKTLIYIDDPLKREFYTAMAIQENWSTRQCH